MAKISTTPMKPGGTNVALGLVRNLLDHQKDFKNIATKIVAECRAAFGKTNLTPLEMAEFKNIVAVRLADEKKKFFSLISEANSIPPPQQLIPAPPPSKELYGLVADGNSIVDVGSGNCLRLQADSGRLKIDAIDPALDEGSKATVKKTKREVVPSDVKGKIVTSFNALCAFKSDDALEAIKEEDGLHVVPDHEKLLESGCAKQNPDGTVTVYVPNSSYTDRVISGPGYAISNGYKMLTMFRSRLIDIRSNDSFDSGINDGYKPKINCSPCSPADIDWGDMGWKWDGIPLEFEINDGRATVTRRDGNFFDASVSGKNIVDMCIHAEWLVEQKKLVLLRIECYNGYVPPHCGEVLRHFAERVEFSWNGMRLNGPPSLDLVVGPVLEGEVMPVDGVITRSRQLDYYVKPEWTVDLRPEGVAAVRERLTALGKTLQAMDPRPGLWEYKMTKKYEHYSLTPIRERRDKDIATSAGTVEYLLSLPTIMEMVAVTGKSPDVEGLVGYFMDI